MIRSRGRMSEPPDVRLDTEYEDGLREIVPGFRGCHDK